MSARVQAADLRRYTYSGTVQMVAFRMRMTYRRLRAAGVDRWTARFTAQELRCIADVVAHGAHVMATHRQGGAR